MPRTVSRFIARLLVGVMMFAQMTVAAYACTGAQAAVMPGVGPSGISGISGADVTMVRAAMTGLAAGAHDHAAIDPAQPNLCAAHCQSGQQNADGRLVASVPAAIPTSLYPRASEMLLAGILRVSAAPHDPPPDADPPHAILHCCFRI